VFGQDRRWFLQHRIVLTGFALAGISQGRFEGERIRMFSRRWLIAALAVVGLTGGCSQFNTNLTVQTSSSSVSFLNPQAVNAGDSAFTITVNGAGFVSGSTYVLWNAGPNEIPLPTTYVSSAQVTAPVPASYVAAAGTVQIAVQIPGSAVAGASSTAATTTTEVSNVVNFTINPTRGTPPVVSTISASTTHNASTPYCSPTGLTLTVSGSNFDATSVVYWNGSQRATTFVNSGQITAAILPQDAAFPGTANVSVSTAAGPSNTVVFTMTTPTTNLPLPTVTAPSQISVPRQSQTFTLRIDGSFLPCSVAQWVTPGNVTSQLATTYVPANQDPVDPAIHLNAIIPASDVFSPGTANITVFNPTPGGGTSSVIAFTIQ